MGKGTADVTVTDRFVFFWRGYLGQWFRSPFVLDGVRYSHAEQAMMAAKARMFNDAEVLAKILAASKPSEQKALGRQVRGYVDEVWKKAARDIVTRVNVAKFSQDPELKQQLLETGDRIIVEASPEDALWGIGIAVDDPRASQPDQWPGKNWLGEALMRAREEIRKGNVVLK
jgi:hypothetical protein